MRKEFAKLGVLLFISCVPFGIVGCMNQHEVQTVTETERLVARVSAGVEERKEVLAKLPPVEVEPVREPPRFTREAPESEPEPAYTEEELEALALVIYQEAGADYCEDETRQMVGEVVLNRVASEYFPDTIEEVLTAPYQYGRLSWTGLVWPERANYDSEAHAVQRAYDVAEALLSGAVERLLPEDTIWQAEFTQGTEIVAHIDGIYFCR